MHSHANRAGYIDLDGCTIGDMLLRLAFDFFHLHDMFVLTLLATATSFLLARSVRLPIRHLVYLLFAVKAQWLSAASVIVKWVSSEVFWHSRQLLNFLNTVFKIPEVKFLLVGSAASK